MGCFGSKPERAEVQPSSASAKPPVQEARSSAQSKLPDFGLDDKFDVVKLLGVGGEGETWLCVDKEKNEEVAIKFIKRPIPKALIQIIQREVRILADLGDGNLNIVGADEVVLTRTQLGLVMEYISGGNMVQYVTTKRETKHKRNGLCLDEDEALYLFKQLISAVAFCHKHHVAHRDLKLDNTLLDGHNPPRLKLCDFGFAKSWGGNQASNMDTMRIGTPEYMAPDLITGRTGYDGQKVDVWACGVLLFVMLSGHFPFEGQEDNSSTVGLYGIWVAQMGTQWKDNPQNARTVQQLSPEVVDLLGRMFDTNQESRISISAIMKHPWFNRPLPQKYVDALQELEEQQSKIDSSVTNGKFRSPERDHALQTLLETATRSALPTEKLIRVSLSKLKRKYTFVEAGAVGMGTLNEDLDEETNQEKANEQLDNVGNRV